MRFLVDADVLSERTKPQPNSRVVQWIEDNDLDLVVSPIVLGEIEHGILLLPAGRRRTTLQRWFEEGVQRIPVLSFDAATASVWAAMLTRLKRSHRAMPLKDSLIAASALAHGLTIATRNTADFRHAGAPLVNPFAN